MAGRDIDPFEIGRRGFSITLREFPIWLACAAWPFATAIFIAWAKHRSIEVSPWITDPMRWVAEAIFDWCWMTALCRSTKLHLLTFPATRGFWLFIALLVGLEAAWWMFYSAWGVVLFATYTGEVPLTDISGRGIQLISGILAVLIVLVGLWAGLRLLIWPAHAVATGSLGTPRTIWRGMQDHSFDMLIIAIITILPLLFFIGGQFIVGRIGEADGLMSMPALKIADVILSVFTRGALDAALLVAYFGIFTKAT